MEPLNQKVADNKTEQKSILEQLENVYKSGLKEADKIPLKPGQLHIVVFRAKHLLVKLFGQDTQPVKVFNELLNDLKKSENIETKYKHPLEYIKTIIDIVKQPMTPTTTTHKNSVFLVHGRNEEIKENVARFLEKFVKVIILHEQPDKGRTIYQKIQDHSNVGAAVVLLTADDKGGERNDDFAKCKLRARQNVIFELGYFIGKLAPSKVFALYEKDVEIPSDYHGVLYLPIDNSSEWKWKLIRELREAGLDIDLNNF